MNIQNKTLPLSEYYRLINEKKKGYKHTITVHLPDAVHKEVSRIAKAHGTLVNATVVNLLAMAVTLYDIDTLMIPIVRITNEGEEITDREGK